MDTTELLKKVRKIEIKTKGLSKQIFSGEYHSAFKGRGMSFSEVRDYQYGDDVRNIDWNVTARTGSPHVKVFEEERELTVMLLIDVSKSSFFGSVKQTKNEINAEIAAVLAFSALNNNDKVGVLFFSNKIEKYLPPKKGKQHVLRIIRELINLEPENNGTNIGMALEYLNNLIKKRCICFVLSDFLTKDYEAPLKIAKRRHDVVGIHIIDPREEAIPNVGLIRAVDSETGDTRWIDSNSKSVRENYSNWFNSHMSYFKNTFLKTGADSVTIRTNESYVNKLLEFFKRRSK
ncbi:MAG: DUF58 domain-containing protein [Saprospiraceae bacterium]|jgi:uncharacterized protein (DUF58 family)|nr:DUF58 domain-containing protein [Saprospiraceae bacterium]MDG1433150.1 DUF58 domain-containing protein [Saprospiraceae bacterium]MDG2419511.1 DUF58 domain-containing protein [Saprospiraceae bacterium]